MITRKKPSRESQADAWQIASALLRYPDEQLLAALPRIREAVVPLDFRQRDALLALIDGWAAADPVTLQREYVETFDLDKNRALHVSWFQYGDRRQRGMVLLKLKRRYQQFELEPRTDELPDHLPLMLEFAAAAPAPEGLALLQEWRAAIELIRGSLKDAESPYAPVLDLVSATLPRLGADLKTAVDKLIAEGPPGDEVGLEPFGPDSMLESGLPAAPAFECAPQPVTVDPGQTTMTPGGPQ